MPTTGISLRKSLDISIPPKTLPLLGHSVLSKTDNDLGVE
jgi:hypothetical protein